MVMVIIKVVVIFKWTFQHISGSSDIDHNLKYKKITLREIDLRMVTKH